MTADLIFAGLRHTWSGALATLALGAVLGSFVNVVIHRLPRGLSLVRPASRCPHCGHRIAPWENVPLLSFLLLAGRCRGCRRRIPWRYPLVEALGAGLTLLAVRTAGGPLGALVGTAFALALLAVVFIDLDARIIPDSISLPGVVVGLIWAGFGPPSALDAVLGVVAGAGGLLLVAVTYRAVAGREGLGMGDVKLLGMVGAFLGWQGALGTLLLGSAAGSAVGVALMARGRGDRHTALPFGTFLAPAAWVVLFAGPSLWRAYLGLFPAL